MRILQKAGRLLRDKKGQAFPLAVALSLACLILLCGLSEYIRLMVIAAGVRDALQASVISADNDNYDDVFHGVREGTALPRRIGMRAWTPAMCMETSPLSWACAQTANAITNSLGTPGSLPSPA